MDNVNNTLYKIVKHYNEMELDKAEKEQRKPELLPHISCHILRHTACTRMLEDGMDVKVVQRIMGYSSIRVTMDVYNHVSDERAKQEVLRREERRLADAEN